MDKRKRERFKHLERPRCTRCGGVLGVTGYGPEGRMHERCAQLPPPEARPPAIYIRVRLDPEEATRLGATPAERVAAVRRMIESQKTTA